MILYVSGAFLLLPELRILRLGNNHLSSLPKDVFWNNRHLEVLDIHSNHFSEVQDTIMYHLHSLQLLNMSFNEVRKTQDCWYKIMPMSMLLF